MLLLEVLSSRTYFTHLCSPVPINHFSTLFFRFQDDPPTSTTAPWRTRPPSPCRSSARRATTAAFRRASWWRCSSCPPSAWGRTWPLTGYRPPSTPRDWSLAPATGYGCTRWTRRAGATPPLSTRSPSRVCCSCKVGDRWGCVGFGLGAFVGGEMDRVRCLVG